MGGAAAGSIAPGGAQWFVLHAETAGAHTLWTKLGTLPDSLLRLYAADRTTVLAVNDDQGGSEAQWLASRIEYFCVPGVYYLKIETFRANQSGTYTVRAEGP